MVDNNTRDPVITIAQAVAVMAKRFPHPLGARYLREGGIAVGRSWAETLAKVTAMDQSNPLAQAVTLKLLELLRTHALIGNKRVTWYDYSEYDKGSIAKFEEWAKGAIAKPPLAKEWVATYPYPLVPVNRATLKAFVQTPVLVDVSTDNSLIYFQFFNVRTYNERVDLNPLGFSKDAYEHIKEYSNIIGVMPQFVPCFDTVVVDPLQKRIDLRLDIPGPSVPGDVQTFAAQRLLAKFNELSLAGSNTAVVGLKAFDFLPLLQPLYRDKDAGKVNALGFTAISDDSDSNNHGKPLRKKGVDLRIEGFHKHGAAGVKDVRPYTIGVEWPAQGRVDRAIELEIPGSVYALYKGRALTVVNILGCFEVSEYEFLTGMVEKYSEMAATLAKLAAKNAQDSFSGAKAIA
jgi:hypothetical protein